MAVAAAVMAPAVVAVPTTVVMPAVLVVSAVVVMPRRRVVVVPAAPPAAPVARSDRVWCRAVSLVSGRRPVMEGLGAGWNCGQQSQCDDDVEPAHEGFLPF
ncbi:hypothetical protein [Belnapia rosea]|uniref:Uncharacterized protein n=1 Tax=Belnapia rosea TaxID=938405 RepID=A0A1G6YYZ7_9PROT|nr:hypothetical protein [Belnapia rosea]SDD94847.1 hypothetical protein SAMN04487779_101538 [Belnapia rosea]